MIFSTFLSLMTFCASILLSPPVVAEDNLLRTAKAHYGKAMPASAKPIRLRDAISGLEGSPSHLQKMSGIATKVCRKKGCWMILVDDDVYARVTFKDYQFFVPTDTTNQAALVYGVLNEKTLSGGMARHYAEDAGLPAAEVADSRREYSIVAQSVVLN